MARKEEQHPAELFWKDHRERERNNSVIVNLSQVRSGEREIKALLFASQLGYVYLCVCLPGQYLADRKYLHVQRPRVYTRWEEEAKLCSWQGKGAIVEEELSTQLRGQWVCTCIAARKWRKVKEFQLKHVVPSSQPKWLRRPSAMQHDFIHVPV